MDYRPLADLSDSICPFEIRDYFTKRIISLTNVGDKNLESPQWLLIKEQGYLLWGVVCLNKLLGEEYSTDLYGIPLRGFTGVVIPNYANQPLPNSIDTFSIIFREVMAVLYESFTQSQLTNKAVDLSITSSWISPQPFVSGLNTDNHYCRFFSPTVDAELLVASCLSCPTDISIATNVANKDSVTTPKFFPLHNAVMRYDLQSETEDIRVKHPCGKCGKEVDDLQDGLCHSCWREMRPPKPIKQKCTKCGKETEWLQQGMCNECYEKTHEKPIIHCPKCGRETSFLVKNKKCEECYQKQRKRDGLFYIILIVFMLTTLCVKKCHRKTNTPQPPVQENHDERKKQQQSDSTVPFPKLKADSSKMENGENTSEGIECNKKE